MRELKFQVREQRLSKAGQFSKIVAGSKGYLACQFEFSPDWAGMAKAASFFGEDGEEHAARIENDRCNVPDEVTDGGSFKMRVTGRSKSGFVRTTEITINQEVL